MFILGEGPSVLRYKLEFMYQRMQTYLEMYV